MARRLWTDARRRAGGCFLSIVVQTVYPAVLPDLRTDFGLDLTTAELLITALWVAYALGKLSGGLLDDRVGAGRLLVASTAVSAVMLALVVAVGSVGTLFVGTVFFGFATALYGVPGFTLLVSAYPDHGGRARTERRRRRELRAAAGRRLPGRDVRLKIGLGFAVPSFLLAGVGLHVAVPDDGPSTGSRSPSRPGSGGLSKQCATTRLRP